MPPTYSSIADLLDAPDRERKTLLDRLVPAAVRRHYGLPAQGPWREGTSGTHRWRPGERPGVLLVEVWPEPEGEDPALVVELADQRFARVELAWVVLNDIRGPRYHVDRDAAGNPLPLGSGARNLPEELRALDAGLAPNQVRPGVGAFRQLVHAVQDLARALGAETLQVVPLAYHNAIQYERLGFIYRSEEVEPADLHRQFQPGGELHRRLDGSTPFRRPEMAATVRGRSWAIHDGLLGRRWVPPVMYKFTDRDFSLRTFPDAVW